MSAQRTTACLLGACGLYCIVGCAAPAPIREPKAEPVRTVSTGKLLVAWHEPAADRRVNPVLEIEAESGVVEQGTQSGHLENARGRIYRDGVLRARFSARSVDADMAAQRVFARNNVVVESAAPEGLTLRAREVEWLAQKNRIVAVGDVMFVQKDRETGRVVAEGGPFDRITVDTSLQRLTIP